jgi:hypothetical protein
MVIPIITFASLEAAEQSQHIDSRLHSKSDVHSNNNNNNNKVVSLIATAAGAPVHNVHVHVGAPVRLSKIDAYYFFASLFSNKLNDGVQ